MQSMAGSTWACCAGPWILADSTKSSLSATRHSFRGWRIVYFQSVVDA